MSYHPIQLDKIRNFRYGMRAISLIEKRLKKPISKIDIENLLMDEAAIMIWAGLVHEDKSLTPDNVMDIVDDHSNTATVMRAMFEAFKEDFGAEDDPGEDPGEGEDAEQGKNE